MCPARLRRRQCSFTPHRVDQTRGARVPSWLLKGETVGLMAMYVGFLVSKCRCRSAFVRSSNLRHDVHLRRARCFFRPTAGAGGSAMTSALAPLIPLVTPHFRKGEVDLALIKHQAIAVAAGLAVRTETMPCGYTYRATGYDRGGPPPFCAICFCFSSALGEVPGSRRENLIK